MRLSEFRALMDEYFGPRRAPSVAKDHVFGELGGLTADQAIEAGINPREIWAQVCREFEVPAALRFGLPD
ncbi:DUF3046 domain-containing protein [Nakamurella aerolata]|uniref:DUF3046 domain-containing protein n=1 Tax=Nakamurella aerolata TaxID=1656892 RepID=A0A849A966_9ACTN|nr:DUF3046 domain-containing protein [Nakamurella aerolata]